MPEWLLKQIGLSHHLEGVVCYLAILLSRPLSLLSFSFFSFPFSYPLQTPPKRATRSCRTCWKLLLGWACHRLGVLVAVSRRCATEPAGSCHFVVRGLGLAPAGLCGASLRAVPREHSASPRWGAWCALGVWEERFVFVCFVVNVKTLPSDWHSC